MNINLYYQDIQCTSADVMNEIMEAIDKTREVAMNCKFHKNDIIYLQLVVEEACYNAFEYCQKTKREVMTITWKTDQEYLTISVGHEGEHFELKKQEETNYARRGRGLQLILHFMDDVWVESRNTHVELVMKKYLNDDRQKRTG